MSYNENRLTRCALLADSSSGTSVVMMSTANFSVIVSKLPIDTIVVDALTPTTESIVKVAVKLEFLGFILLLQSVSQQVSVAHVLDLAHFLADEIDFVDAETGNFAFEESQGIIISMANVKISEIARMCPCL